MVPGDAPPIYSADRRVDGWRSKQSHNENLINLGERQEVPAQNRRRYCGQDFRFHDCLTASIVGAPHSPVQSSPCDFRDSGELLYQSSSSHTNLLARITRKTRRFRTKTLKLFTIRLRNLICSGICACGMFCFRSIFSRRFRCQ